MYGYTMVYRYTRDPRMLAAAQKTTDWYLNHLPADMVPLWDFSAPAGKQFKDTSAAAAAASALLELSGYVSDAATRQRYHDAAVRMLDALSAAPYLASGTSKSSVLQHGVGNFPAGKEIDVGLIYGDYYFIEAIQRFRLQSRLQAGWPSRVDFSAAVHGLGTTNTGTVTAQFDLTPARSPIDGVIGYADSSTTIKGFSSSAMLIRMDTDGFFDARNGGGYAALTAVPYAANTTYHVRMVANLGTKRYSVWVRPPGGAEIQLAKDYVFRSDAPLTDDLGKVTLNGTTGDGTYTVTNHTVKLGTVAATASASEAPEAPEAALSLADPLDGSGCAAVPGSAALALCGMALWLMRHGRCSRVASR
jgi:unsaturated chondroitin disaccharide hydrolase